MGGKNETKIGGLRLHENAGEIHVHDDGKGIKFIMASPEFKEEFQDALDQLKSGSDGIAKLEGSNGVPLYVLKDGNSYNVFVGGPGVKGDWQKFVRGI